MKITRGFKVKIKRPFEKVKGVEVVDIYTDEYGDEMITVKDIDDHEMYLSPRGPHSFSTYVRDAKDAETNPAKYGLAKIKKLNDVEI